MRAARRTIKRLTNRLLRRQQVIEGVIVEFEAPPEEIAAVQDVLASSGFQVAVKPLYPLTGGPPTELTWVLSVVLGVPLTAFFTALGTAAGTDAYGGLKVWVKRVRDARRPTPGPGEVRLHDPHTSMAIPAEIPDEAIDALREIDWSAVRGGHLIWVEEQRAWRDTRDLVE